MESTISKMKEEIESQKSEEIKLLSEIENQNMRLKEFDDTID